ncbi:phage tail protein [Pseudoalteromonas sp. M8]|uniref:phage tail-collar fiber domain-containing protein n=1 Tax=Pseudoalteromonas sp. M8 TaxID=2692624 RepID=UPI001BAE38BE|nr:phage tail protein [Pseudoalteromonas sp. M8]QUI71248.1 hypothetical protein GSF13_16485 [Pseudoalteromonas sp. M8]
MSQLKITSAGIAYKNDVFAGTETLNITKMVFAHVSGLNADSPILSDSVPANIVHNQPIDRVSSLDGDAVVISSVLGYDVGNFTFNWFGAIAKKANGTEVLIAVVHTNEQTKTRTDGANTGDYSVKSIIWRSQQLAGDLNVTLPTLPWQVNDGVFATAQDLSALTVKLNRRTHGKSIAVDLSDQVQLTSYRKSVIALCKLINTTSTYESWNIGTLTFSRVNGIEPNIISQVAVSRKYNTESLRGNLQTNGSKFTPRLCTFEIGGVRYGGVEFYYSAAHHDLVTYSGTGSFEPFGLDYYNLLNNVALNQEVADTIDFNSTIVFDDEMAFNGARVLTEKRFCDDEDVITGGRKDLIVTPEAAAAGDNQVRQEMTEHGLGNRISYESNNFLDRTFSLNIPGKGYLEFPNLPETACDILIFGLTDGTGTTTNFVGRLAKYGSTWSAEQIYGVTGGNNPTIDIINNVPVFRNHHELRYTFRFKCWIACQSGNNAKPFEFFANIYSTYNKPTPANISSKLGKFDDSIIELELQNVKIGGKRALKGNENTLHINYLRDHTIVKAYGDWNFTDDVSFYGDISIEKEKPWLTLLSSSSGDITNEQAAGISIGESGRLGSASLHISYTGDGLGYIGMGHLGEDSIANYWAMQMHYQNSWVKFRSQIRLGDDGTKLYKGNGDTLRIETRSGIMELGPKNAGFCHFATDKPKYYMDKPLYVYGDIFAGQNYNSKVYHETNKPSASDIQGGAFPEDMFAKQSKSWNCRLSPHLMLRV